MSKICTVCKELKSLEFYGKSKRSEDGFHYCCKECRSNSYRTSRTYEIEDIVDIDGEVWIDITAYEGYYQVSNKGRVKGLCRNVSMNGGTTFRTTTTRIIIGKTNPDGYKSVSLTLNGKSKMYFVHRLVAQEFLKIPEGCNVVNHIDCNPSNNNVENLEWTTQKGNIRHAAKLGRMTHGSRHHASKKVIQYSRSGDYITSYDTISEASRITGSQKSGIYCSCNRITLTCNGFIWKYAV